MIRRNVKADFIRESWINEARMCGDMWRVLEVSHMTSEEILEEFLGELRRLRYEEDEA